jgi:hypothetical protein
MAKAPCKESFPPVEVVSSGMAFSVTICLYHEIDIYLKKGGKRWMNFCM